MGTERHDRISRLFLAACELLPPERAAFLDRACSDDPSLRAEIEALLARDEEDPEFLIPESPDRPGNGPAAPAQDLDGGCIDMAPESESVSQTAALALRDYAVREVLGEGGMGIVYLAEQLRPVRRKVALKVIRLGMDSAQVVARFEAERQALALMNHPNIAQVYEAGTTENGRPYFVMEYVPGIPITTFCDTHKLDTRERLSLFTEVCGALQHAHHKGILHRDIKPANILITIQDEKAVPKVIDFGVAKALNQALTERTLFTEHGKLIGTPEYMSPEQAEMTPLDVDHRTDIYSLGVVLYELLVGALPFDAKELRRAGFAEIQRKIREDEPLTPSTRLSHMGEESIVVAEKRHTELRTLERLVRGELDWITMKALEKDRRRRYLSAAEFAADIRRHLIGEPITARPQSASYKLARSIRRNKMRYTFLGAVLILLVAFGMTVRTISRNHATDKLLDDGWDLMEEYVFDTAEAKFAEARILRPGYYDVYYKFGVLRREQYLFQLLHKRNPYLLADSLQFFERATLLAPKEAKCHNGKAPTLYLLHRLSEAEQACRTALALDPTFLWAISNLAKVLALQGRTDEAYESACAATNVVAPKDVNPSYLEGMWLARGALAMHLGKAEDARRSLENAKAKDSTDPRNALLLARYHLLVSRDYVQALQLAIGAQGFAKREYAHLFRILSLAYLRNGQGPEALRYAQEALDAGDLPAASHVIKAIAYAKGSRIEDAKASYQSVLDHWPMDLEESKVLVTADYEYLWFETLEELTSLRDEAQSLVEGSKSP